jgi:hypothetical protein
MAPEAKLRKPQHSLSKGQSLLNLISIWPNSYAEVCPIKCAGD